MPAEETITIINKSGKIVSTGKHLVNIFKDAKAAYNDKKHELKSELFYRARRYNSLARQENRSITSSHRTHRNHRNHRNHRTQPAHRSRHSHRPRRQHNEAGDVEASVLPLTTQNLSYMTESSDSSSSCQSPTSYEESHCPPYTITEDFHPSLIRRHTTGPINTRLTSAVSTLPPPYTSHITRTQSNPDLGHDSVIDMDLAYGQLPYDLEPTDAKELTYEEEVYEKIDRIDLLLLEAQCAQSSATAIIHHLKSNPDAMAAVALTLAEISSLVTKMGPSFIGILKLISPTIFGLLISPQFLIATGLAMGATVVMLGGYQIIKRIHSNVEEKKETCQTEKPMLLDGIEIESIKSWQRGVANADSLTLSLTDSEHIRPEAPIEWRKCMYDEETNSSFTSPETIFSEKRCHMIKRKESLTRPPNSTASSDTLKNNSRVVPIVRSTKKSIISPDDSASNIGRKESLELRSRRGRNLLSEVDSKDKRMASSKPRTRRSRDLNSDVECKSIRNAPSKLGSRRRRDEKSKDGSKSSRAASSVASSQSSRFTSSVISSNTSRDVTSEAGSKSSGKSVKSTSSMKSKTKEVKKRKGRPSLSTIFEIRR